MKKPILVVVSVILVAGCASTPKDPEWINGESAEYPSARYLTGLGEADSAAIARDRARADLAKVFQVHIEERLQDSTNVSLTRQGDGEAGQSTDSRIERRLTLSTQQVLKGVEVPEVWKDEAKRYHALAVFDRLRAGEQLRKEINVLDALVEREIEQARSGQELLLRIGAAGRAMDAQITREQLQKVMRVVDPTGMGVPGPYDSTRLESDFQQLAGRLKLSASVEKDAGGRLESIMGGSIAHAGFTSVDETEADYRLVGALHLDEMAAEGWQWSRGTLDLKLLDRNGVIRGTWEWPIKASGQHIELARQRALQEVDHLLKDQLRTSILSP